MTAPQSRADSIYRVVDRRYELLDLIGSGAAAHVYRARDLLLHREVAVKMLTEEAAADPAFVERFQREALAIASFNHPNIVTVYDWGTAGYLDYMVMEYVSGGSLSDILKERHRLDEGEALQLAVDVARALAAAHERSIVHRDIKPDNVLLSLDGRPKVADFGIAWAQGLSDLTLTNTICGTVSYISPEQARGEPLDGRSDLYSLGVVLYQMVTGRLPFQGSSLAATAIQHIEDDPVPPREIQPGITPQTERIIRTALAKQPERRYHSAMAMVEALERSRASALSLPVQAPPIEAGLTTHAPLNVPREEIPRRGTGLPSERRASFASRAVWIFPTVLLALLSGLAMAAHPWDTSHHRQSGPPSVQPTSPASAPKHKTAAQRTNGSAAGRPSASTSTPNGTKTPQDTVIQFYTDVGNHRFADARRLWTAALQRADPPSAFIDQRFSNTQSIWVDGVAVQRSDPAGNTAWVAAHVTETVGPGGSSRQYSGTWEVVQQNGGWLLNQPNLHQIAVAPPSGKVKSPGHGKGAARGDHKHGDH